MPLTRSYCVPSDPAVDYMRLVLNQSFLTVEDGGETVRFKEPQWEDIMMCCQGRATAINTTLYRNLRPLHVAAMWANTEAVKFLLENGANPEASDWRGQNALHLLAREWVENGIPRLGDLASRDARYEACVKVLIEGGVSVDEEDENGNTPLQLSCLQENSVLVRLLLQNFATPDYCNTVEEAYFDAREPVDRIRTPLEGAMRNCNRTIAQLLVESGATRTCNWPRLQVLAQELERKRHQDRRVLDPSEPGRLLEDIRNWSQIWHAQNPTPAAFAG
jgi:ankyrin repeat protein